MRRGLWFLVSLVGGLLAVVAAVAVGSGDGSGTPQAVTSRPARPDPVSTTRPRLVEPLDLVPAETLLCWYGRPFPDTAPPSDQPSPLKTLWQLVPRLAGSALDTEAQLWARVVEGFGLMIRYPHALALIDAKARPLDLHPDSRRVDQLRFALIVQTRGQEEHFARVIQAVVNEQTDSQKARLTRQRAGDWSYQELRDSRLPDWCVLAWGRIGEHFVFTVGADVWPAVAAVATGQAPGLSRDDWLRHVRGPRGQAALIEIIVSATGIRDSLDPFLDGRASGFFRAWHAESIERMHWALGFEGRALYCVAHFLEGGKTRKRLYADPAIHDPRLLATIPETARYAIYRVSAARVIRDLCAGILATRGPEFREEVEKHWAQIQAEHGFDAQRDILAHLGDYIVMHNDPPHPLRIPLAMTVLTEIRAEPDQVRQSIDTMFQAWQDIQRKHVEQGGTPGVLTVARDDAGIWYLQFGPLAGPACTVTDRFIITSWSPAALRMYLDKVGQRAGKRGE